MPRLPTREDINAADWQHGYIRRSRQLGSLLYRQNRQHGRTIENVRFRG